MNIELIFQTVVIECFQNPLYQQNHENVFGSADHHQAGFHKSQHVFNISLF